METPPVPRVTHAERLNDGVIITFEDGKCAIYSTSLLYATLTQAETIASELEDED